jgi:hypothetical protein
MQTSWARVLVLVAMQLEMVGVGWEGVQDVVSLCNDVCRAKYGVVESK